jgi:hypothetical protein
MYLILQQKILFPILGIGIVLSRLIINIIPLKIIKLISLYSRSEICMNQEGKKRLRIGCEGCNI